VYPSADQCNTATIPEITTFMPGIMIQVACRDNLAIRFYPKKQKSLSLAALYHFIGGIGGEDNDVLIRRLSSRAFISPDDLECIGVSGLVRMELDGEVWFGVV